MKLATFVCLMAIVAIVNASLVRENMGHAVAQKDTQVTNLSFGYLMDLMKGTQVDQNTTCPARALNLFFSVAGIVNLIIHGTEATVIFQRLITVIMDLHATLVECGIL